MNDSALLERRDINLAGDPRSSSSSLNGNGNNTGISNNGGNGSRLALHENALPVRIEMLRNVALNCLKVTTLNSKVKRYQIPLPHHDAAPPSPSPQDAGPFPKPVV